MAAFSIRVLQFLFFIVTARRTHYIPLYVLADKSILQKQREQILQGEENNMPYTILSQTY